MTDKPRLVAVEPKAVVVLPPDSITQRCKGKKRQPAATQVGVIVNRLSYTEAALDECGAQADAVIEWKARQQALAGKAKSTQR